MELEKLASKKAELSTGGVKGTAPGTGTGRPEMGRVGSCRLPVAMAYVPAQENPDTFQPVEALDHGTLYPGLELPFKNNFNVKKLDRNESNELMAYGFAVHELALYLDTHADDTEALAMYKRLKGSYNTMREAYVKKHGPVGRFDMTDGDRYMWTDGPWPWELD